MVAGEGIGQPALYNILMHGSAEPAQRGDIHPVALGHSLVGNLYCVSRSYCMLRVFTSRPYRASSMFEYAQAAIVGANVDSEGI